LYRFPDLAQFEAMISGMGESELELGLPSGEVVDDGEWVLAIFELGRGRRATSAAARASIGPEGARLMFEPRDWRRLAEFAYVEARRPPAPSEAPPPGPARGKLPEPPVGEGTYTPETEKSAITPMPRAASNRPPGNACVLVVDDDPDIREVVAAMLEAVGLTVFQSASAEEALGRVRSERFDLLVLDWNLPKMTGIELCRVIRREAGLSHVPVLFLTANASSQDMVDAFASGADDYVVKPFRAPELGARIFSLLRRGRMLQGV
jgi:two-component system phosphate regulon response regulator PhoB